MTAIARFTASRAAAKRVTDFSGPGGSAAFALDGGAQLARTVAAALGDLDHQVLGVEVVLHDTRLDVPATPDEPFPYVMARLSDVDAGAAAATAYLAGVAAAGRPLDAHELTRAVLAGIDEAARRVTYGPAAVEEADLYRALMTVWHRNPSAVTAAAALARAIPDGVVPRDVLESAVAKVWGGAPMPGEVLKEVIAVLPEGAVTREDPASRDGGPLATGRTPHHLAVTDLDQRDRIVVLMHLVDEAVTGRVREARMDGQEYTDAYASTLRLLADAGMRCLDDRVSLEVVHQLGVIVAAMAAAGQGDLGTTPTGWAYAALETSGWMIAPSTSALVEQRVEAFARRLAHRYRDSDTVPEGQIRVMWIPVTERLLADAGMSDLSAPVTPEVAENVTRGVYAKMTESDGAGFDTSTQRSRWVSWTTRMLALSGWEVRA
jgi:hypothetical protein